MANFVLFLALLCLQICRGEELWETEGLVDGGETQVIPVPDKDDVEFEGWTEDKSAESLWTAEDEKWFQQIQDLLGEDSDEDYDLNDMKFGNLVKEIEQLVNKFHPDKGNYEWLVEIGNWFSDDDDDDDDYDDMKIPNGDDLDDEMDGLDNFYSWIYRNKAGNGKRNQRPLQKRFTSV